MRENAPCYTCIKRCLLCHSHCEEYAAWQKRMKEISQKPKVEVDLGALAVEQKARIRREQRDKWWEKNK